MEINKKFIKEQVEKSLYEISLHADDERINDEITYDELEKALLNDEILEEYPDDPRGESCLILGFISSDKPAHIICGKNKDENLLIITVYIPAMPKWKNPWTRNR